MSPKDREHRIDTGSPANELCLEFASISAAISDATKWMRCNRCEYASKPDPRVGDGGVAPCWMDYLSAQQEGRDVPELCDRCKVYLAARAERKDARKKMQNVRRKIMRFAQKARIK